MKAYFPQINPDEKNVTFAFRYVIDKNYDNLTLSVAASNAFGVIADGKLVFRGPVRSAHGYSHVSEVKFRSVMPTCLVIEDDAETRHYLSSGLTAAGYVVESADKAAAALESAQNEALKGFGRSECYLER